MTFGLDGSALALANPLSVALGHMAEIKCLMGFIRVCGSKTFLKLRLIVANNHPVGD